MAFRRLRQRSVLSLSFMTLLFLLILYAGLWSKIDSEHRRSERLGTEGGVGGEGGGADKRRFINGIIKSIDTEAAAIIQQLIIQKTPAGDPKLIKVARQLINPPPNEGPITLARAVEETPQSKEIDALLKQKLEFRSNKGQLGQVMLNDDITLPPSSREVNMNVSYVVPCFPLETILLAINQTRIDYFSLDVEGLELEVLKTIPFDRIDIQVLTVEYRHARGGKDAYKSFMKSKGFQTYKDLTYNEPKSVHFAQDYIFIKDDMITSSI